MNKAIYHVRDGELDIQFNDCSQAFQYAYSHGLNELFKEVPDQVDWYYFDWDTERWVYP